MFKIKVDGTTICDSRIPESMVLNPVVTLEANKVGSFAFSFPAGHAYINSIDRLSSILEVERDDELIFRGICSRVTEDLYRQPSIECEGEMTYLNDSILRPNKYTGQTVKSLLQAYIDEHNSQSSREKQFKLGKVTVDGGTDIYRFTSYKSPMEEIQEDLLDNFGGYISVRHEDGINYIDYIAESERVCNQTVQLGINLLDYSSNIDDTDLATVVIPLGATLEQDDEEEQDSEIERRLTIEEVNDGRDYIRADWTVMDRFGTRVKVVTWDDVTKPSNLLKKGQKWLKNNQFEKVYIKCKAIDLGYISGVKEKFKLLDQIRIISPIHGMNRLFTLTKMTINLANPSSDTFEFGIEAKIKFTDLFLKSNR